MFLMLFQYCNFNESNQKIEGSKEQGKEWIIMVKYVYVLILGHVYTGEYIFSTAPFKSMSKIRL